MPKKIRKFLPEPIETSSRSHKDTQSNSPSGQHTLRTQLNEPPRVSDAANNPNKDNWLNHNRKKESDWAERTKADLCSGRNATQNPSSSTVAQQKQDSARKFTPQLMETARHSFRRERNQFSSDSSTEARLRTLSHTSTYNKSTLTGGAQGIHESRFSYSSLLQRQESRRHSFRVPDLPAIPSSCSEGSSEPALPVEPGPPSVPSRISAPRRDTTKQATDGYDAHVPDYILPFPVHPSENQLKDQALAAFPNEQVYQPVDHFAIDREEDEWTCGEDTTFNGGKPEPRPYRRASSTDLSWELEYLRRHKEKVGMKDRHIFGSRGGRFSRIARRASRSVDKSIMSHEKWDMDRELTRVRCTNPPMLGGDLIFPQSLSPETTICEGTHAISSSEVRNIFSGFPGLWNSNPRQSTEHDGGLWMGTCKTDRRRAHYSDSLVPGIMIQSHDFDGDGWKLLGAKFTPNYQNQYPITILSKNHHRLEKESNHMEDNDQEFNDAFVTQIYNYLSLGYPSVARYYDNELSKVSGVPLAALRGNDLNTDAKGHVGVQDIAPNVAPNGECMRWVALRLYIREWARQQPDMVETESYHETWGVRERKGSWAF